jgi:hypothetical protein
MSTISRRQFLQGGSLFAGALALTACGGGNTDAKTEATDTATDAAETTDAIK